ncbi:MAG: ABC transporter permease, partial [Caldilineaceae bacterium]
CGNGHGIVHVDRGTRAGGGRMTSVALTGREATWRRALTRNGWVLGVWLLLSVLLFWYATLIPRFGQFQVVSISKNSLPLAYLAIGQAIIVIAGGIDLSVGALLLLGNVVAARFMEDQALGTVFAIGFVLIVGIAVLNGLVGYIISVSGVPDIVVTLATSYIWSGVALWILPSPGGGTAPQVRWLFTGSPSGIGGTFVTPILMMLIPAVLVYLFSQRTRLGLAMYAIGSDSTAARRPGWTHGAPRWRPRRRRGHGRAGRAGDRGHHRDGDPRFSGAQTPRLQQCGSRGARRHRFDRRRRVGAGRGGGGRDPHHVESDSHGHGHQPQQCPGHPGRPHRWGDDGGRRGHNDAGAQSMSGPAQSPLVDVDGRGSMARAREFVAERPEIILIVVLAALILLTGAIEPAYLSVNGARNTLLQAAPLGILAGAQTILMLTGGIDLSITMIATGSAYVAANQSPNGAAIAILLGITVGLIAGSANGTGVAIFRVNPLIMTLAMSGILLGLFTAWTQTILQGSTQVAPFIKLLGTGSFFGNRIPYSVVVWALRRDPDLAAQTVGVGAADLRGRRQRSRGATGGRAHLAGARLGVRGGRHARLDCGHPAGGAHGRGRSATGDGVSPAVGGGCGHRRHVHLRRRGRLRGTILGADPERAQLHAHLSERGAGDPTDRLRHNRAGPGMGLWSDAPHVIRVAPHAQTKG